MLPAALAQGDILTILWSPKLEIGIRQIDLQHRELVEIINELESAHMSGRDALVLEDILPRLQVYAVFHFNEEEVLAEKIAAEPAHVTRHIAEHRDFSEKISSFGIDPRQAASPAVADLANYLQTWVLRHILQTDRQLADMYHSHPQIARKRREA